MVISRISLPQLATSQLGKKTWFALESYYNLITCFTHDEYNHDCHYDWSKNWEFTIPV